MSFDQAQALMQSQGIKTYKDFIEWKQAGKRPKDFPSTPDQVYTNEWRGWGDFLGTGNISNQKRDWMSFDEAKALMQSQGIKTYKDFIEWKQAGKRPEKFPSNPSQTYKNEWRGWRNFFGTENISRRKEKWMSFDEAKIFIQKVGLTSLAQFQEWSKSEQRPENFPSSPNKFYKGEWTNWADFLGTKNISGGRKKEWMSFHDAKALMQSQGIKTNREFIKWKKDGKRPESFPSNPNQVYTNEWRGWGDFLSTKNISTGRKKEWMSFHDAKALMQSQGIRTREQFKEWSKSEQRPKNFPSNPQNIYKNKWRGWGDFLGTGNTISYMKYSTAKKYVQSLEFEQPKDFIEWLQSDDRPENFPPNPQKVYSEWTSLKDFLSTKEYMTYEEVKTFVQQLGITNQRDFFEEMKNNSDIFPENFPPNPKAFYTNTGEWIDWNDFLGLTNKSDNKINNPGENFQIEGDEPGQEDIFTDAEEGSKWGEDAEI